MSENTKESFKDRAIKKLEKEIESKKNDRSASVILNYLIERCKEDEGLSEDVCQEHKTYSECYSYIFDKAREHLSSKSGMVEDSLVYEWAEDYYHKDDKAEEEAKAKKLKEKKEEADNKADKTKTEPSDKPKDINNSSESENKTEGNLGAQNKAPEEPKTEKPKKAAKKEASEDKTKDKNEMEGQMDIFSFLGM